jgi:hypothetical protein
MRNASSAIAALQQETSKPPPQSLDRRRVASQLRPVGGCGTKPIGHHQALVSHDRREVRKRVHLCLANCVAYVARHILNNILHRSRRRKEASRSAVDRRGVSCQRCPDAKGNHRRHELRLARWIGDIDRVSGEVCVPMQARRFKGESAERVSAGEYPLVWCTNVREGTGIRCWGRRARRQRRRAGGRCRCG